MMIWSSPNLLYGVKPLFSGGSQLILMVVYFEHQLFRKKNTRLNCVSPTDASAVSRDARRQVALAGSFAIWIFHHPRGIYFNLSRECHGNLKCVKMMVWKKEKTFLSIAAIQWYLSFEKSEMQVVVSTSSGEFFFGAEENEYVGS